tara:strand:+ start:24161 stop:24751 length:591 start_codon:yes stop_codon:yes gene_type:complete
MVKPLSEFNKKNTKHGYELDCKICFRANERKRRLVRIMKIDPEHGNRLAKIQEERDSRGEKPIEHAWCYNCKIYKHESDFSKSNLNNSGQCRECSNDKDIQRNRLLKLKAIEYKGGVCVRCGFDGHYSSFDFHHLNPSEKEFMWTKARKSTFEKIKDELDKCDLLCSNCHSVVHSKLNNDGSLNKEYVISSKNEEN